MGERTSYVDGEPCWADVMARDAAAARHFYQTVFGWTYQISDPEFGGYAICLAEGRPVAGIMPIGSDMADAPAAWNVYLASSHVDETAQKMEKAGARIMMTPADIPGSGRMAFAFDPTGAGVGLWQGAGHIGFGTVAEPNSFAWTELNTGSPAEADAFYRELFGYQQQQVGSGDFDYTVWSLADNQVCGRMALPAEAAGTPAHWMPYYAVEDTDAAIGRITEAGGALRHPPHDSPYGRLAVVSDPDGAAFTIIDLSRAA